MVLRIYRSSIAKPTPRAAEEPDHVGEDHDGGWIPEKHARRPHGRDPEAVGEQVRRAARGVLLLPQPERLTRALCPARPRHPPRDAQGSLSSRADHCDRTDCLPAPLYMCLCLLCQQY